MKKKLHSYNYNNEFRQGYNYDCKVNLIYCCLCYSNMTEKHPCKHNQTHTYIHIFLQTDRQTDRQTEKLRAKRCTRPIESTIYSRLVQLLESSCWKYCYWCSYFPSTIHRVEGPWCWYVYHVELYNRKKTSEEKEKLPRFRRKHRFLNSVWDEYMIS